MDDNRNNNFKKNPNFNFNNNRMALMFLVAVTILSIIIFSFLNSGMETEISYTRFISLLETGNIQDVEIQDNEMISGKLVDENGQSMTFKTRIPYFDDNLLVMLQEKGVNVRGGTRPVGFWYILLQLFPWLLFIVFIFLIMRNMQGSNRIFSFGNSKAKRIDGTKQKVTFRDVAGQKEAKYELEEVVDFLKFPERYRRIGARIPRGVLLVGFPGTGKTLLAKAVSGEAGVPFFHMSGSDFVEMFVGVGASRVRDLFEQGKKNAPSILFIDEIDAVGRTRGSGLGGGHDEREQTLNQLLVEMDGFGTEENVIVMAATNRPDVLDPALLRPGRFDRQVVVDMPDVKEREEILKIHAKKVKLEVDVDFSVIARATPGTSGADIANLVNEAALFAARRKSDKVGMLDFEEARDKVLMGVARKSKVMDNKEKTMTAYHEAGHALPHYYLDKADPIHKVSIVPRGRALGVTFALPEKDQYSYTKSQLMDKIKILYGGYAAETLIYGETTTGTSQDIKSATDIAHRMVCEWGMTLDLGPVALGGGDEPIFLGKDMVKHKDFSEDTSAKIDVEMKKILDSCLAEVTQIIQDHQDQLKTLAEALIEKETLDDKDIRELLGIGTPKIEGPEEEPVKE